MGGPYQRSAEEGGGQTETFPFEVWRYRYLEGIGQEIEIEFVDDCGCGSYEMTLDRSKKDALLHVPNAGLTTMEEMGQANKADRFRGGLEAIGEGPFNRNNQTKQFDRMETFAKLNRAPKFAVRHRNRCKVCGRARGYYRKFELCRICLRLFALRGDIPGVLKASW